MKRYNPELYELFYQQFSQENIKPFLHEKQERFDEPQYEPDYSFVNFKLPDIARTLTVVTLTFYKNDETVRLQVRWPYLRFSDKTVAGTILISVFARIIRSEFEKVQRHHGGRFDDLSVDELVLSIHLENPDPERFKRLLQNVTKRLITLFSISEYLLKNSEGYTEGIRADIEKVKARTKRKIRKDVVTT